MTATVGSRTLDLPSRYSARLLDLRMAPPPGTFCLSPSTPVRGMVAPGLTHPSWPLPFFTDSPLNAAVGRGSCEPTRSAESSYREPASCHSPCPTPQALLPHAQALTIHQHTGIGTQTHVHMVTHACTLRTLTHLQVSPPKVIHAHAHVPADVHTPSHSHTLTHFHSWYLSDTYSGTHSALLFRGSV